MTGERRKGMRRIPSFGDQQAKLAKQAIEEGLDLGENLFECTQGEFKSHGIIDSTDSSTASANPSFVVLPEPGQVGGFVLLGGSYSYTLDGSKRVFLPLWRPDRPSHVP